MTTQWRHKLIKGFCEEKWPKTSLEALSNDLADPLKRHKSGCSHHSGKTESMTDHAKHWAGRTQINLGAQ